MDQDSLGIRGPRYEIARDRARGLLTLTRQRPPVDVEAIIERANIPVVQRVLIDGVRGTIGDVAGQRAIILNRRHRFSSEQERRWVLAEELGHVLLNHKLVESPEPGQPVIGLLEERRVIYEREARAFAAGEVVALGLGENVTDGSTTYVNCYSFGCYGGAYDTGYSVSMQLNGKVTEPSYAKGNWKAIIKVDFSNYPVEGTWEAIKVQ